MDAPVPVVATIYLRRYTSGLDNPCMANPPWGHDAIVGPVALVPYSTGDCVAWEWPWPAQYACHPAWPTQCQHCSYQFTADDIWQVQQLAATAGQ